MIIVMLIMMMTMVMMMIMTMTMVMMMMTTTTIMMMMMMMKNVCNRVHRSFPLASISPVHAPQTDLNNIKFNIILPNTPRSCK